jgi:endoglucanase
MLSPPETKPNQVAQARCSVLLALCMSAACGLSRPGSTVVTADNSAAAVQALSQGSPGTHPVSTTILVNQLGYAPALPKRATLRDTATTPLAWQLLDRDGAQVAQGDSVPFGLDPASNMHVHAIDFSAFRASGRRYQLQVGAHRSHPFDILQGVYTPLARDALRFF